MERRKYNEAVEYHAAMAGVRNMPIRFRCAYCNQLLGIARRKAGTVVRCPTCAGHIVVPSLPSDETEQAPDKNGNSSVFEQGDFENLLSAAGAEPSTGKKDSGSSDAPVALSPPAEPPPGAWGTHAEPPYNLERVKPSSVVLPAAPIAQPVGMILNARKRTLLFTLGGIALVVTFSIGVLVGYYIRM
jgi:hypothetical protein